MINYIWAFLVAVSVITGILTGNIDCVTNAAFDSASLAAAITESAAEIPFNLVQGTAGIVIAAVLIPILKKIPDIREWLNA